ncbi:hypothetical protein HMPREF1261_00417 [Corynebacterium sp. KPL1818]|nr:hypothetical protein HMPREF1261_00417 [Corynebacterium sp. KPL1818]
MHSQPPLTPHTRRRMRNMVMARMTQGSTVAHTVIPPLPPLPVMPLLRRSGTARQTGLTAATCPIHHCLVHLRRHGPATAGTSLHRGTFQRRTLHKNHFLSDKNRCLQAPIGNIAHKCSPARSASRAQQNPLCRLRLRVHNLTIKNGSHVLLGLDFLQPLDGFPRHLHELPITRLLVIVERRVELV